MASFTKRMAVFLLSLAAAVVAISAQGYDYLPPNKGYNYPQPNVPFPSNNNGVKAQPSPRPAPPPRPARPATSPARPPPPPARPNYLPPQPAPPGKDTYVPPPQTHHHNQESHDDHHHEPGMPFDFAYAVNEDGNDFSHNAMSDGDVTRGEYRIALPDGRTQIVKYTADWKAGFNAEVTYEGQARYPDQPNGAFAGGSGGYKY